MYTIERCDLYLYIGKIKIQKYNIGQKFLIGSNTAGHSVCLSDKNALELSYDYYFIKC